MQLLIDHILSTYMNQYKQIGKYIMEIAISKFKTLEITVSFIFSIFQNS